MDAVSLKKIRMDLKADLEIARLLKDDDDIAACRTALKTVNDMLREQNENNTGRLTGVP